MSRVGMRRFLETAANDRGLSREFSDAVANMATRAGFDVTNDDVGRLLQELARDHAIRDERPRATTLAVGEEDGGIGRLLTQAIPEEGSSRRGDDRDDFTNLTDADPEEDDGGPSGPSGRGGPSF